MTGNTFGKWLRATRTNARLSLSELGRKAKLDKALISKVELGQREVTYEFACKIAIAFDMPADDLLFMADLREREGGINNVQRAFEITQLLNAIPDDNEFGDAIADIRALFSSRKARLEARAIQHSDHAATGRVKPTRRVVPGD